MKLKFEEENKGKIEIICQKYYQIVYDHCFFSLLIHLPYQQEEVP